MPEFYSSNNVNKDLMAIGWIYNHFAIIVTTARNSGMIVSDVCLKLLLIGRDWLIDYIKVLRHINTKRVIQCQNRWVR